MVRTSTLGMVPQARGKGPRSSRSVLSLATLLVVTASAVVLAGTGANARVAPRAAVAATAATAVVISDTMNRASTSGWGSADVGGSYVTADPSAFSVNGSQALIKLPAPGQSRTARLGVTAISQTAAVSLGVKNLPTSGNGVSVALLVREGSGKAYRASVRIQPGGKTSLAVVRIDGSVKALTPIGSEVPLPGALAAGSQLNLEFGVTGTTNVDLTARAWPKGSPAPAAQISQRDSSTGHIAGAGTDSIWAYTSGSSQAATVTIDDYSVTVPITTSTPTPTPSPTPTPTPSATTIPTPPPSPTPPPRPTPVFDTPAQPGPEFGGAKKLGSINYLAPAGALFVSPSGSDAAAGSLAAPLRTVARAISAATSGQTIVLRAGSYHESVVIPSVKRLTIQPYGTEIAWLDGSSVVSSWSASGRTWRAANWTAEFDASPTYTRGATDSTQPSWGFVDPAYPMAAHPDQVWIDNVAQIQVSTLAAVRTGTFYVDYAANALYLGSNPTAHVVRASDISKAISVRSEGSVLRGFGVGRYAPSVPDLGAVTIEKPRGTVDNMVFSDNSTTGVSVVATDITVTNVTSTRNGLLGVHANYADRLQVTGLSATSNNLERFNSSPVSGGFKITRSRDVSVAASQFNSNLGLGLWLDESAYNIKISNNKILRNTSHGISVELSAKATLVGNVIANNDGFGMKINNTSQVRVWNNTLVDNGRPINIVQDTRRASNKSTPGHDPRQTFPDPTMTWLNGPVEVRNNIISGTTGNCLLCVEDYSRERSAEQMRISALGDVYRRPTTSSPQWVVVWAKGAGNPGVFTSVTLFKQATGQESASLALDAITAVTGNGAPTARVQAAVPSVAQPLPADLATLAGQPAGSRWLGSKLTF